MSYALKMEYYDINKKRNVLSLTHIDGVQLLVENAKEKMFVYIYKQRDNYRSLRYPGMRYQFRFNRSLVNQGMMYDMPLRLYAPQKEEGSTFNFTITLDDTTLYINDGLKQITFDVFAIGKTIDIKDIAYPIDQAKICNETEVDIYQNTRGDDLE